VSEETATPAAEAPQLDARARKAARERERRRMAKEQRERLRETAPAEPAASAPAAAPAALDAPAGRTDDDRARDLAVFLRGVIYPVLAVVAMFTPWRLDLAAFKDADAEEEARAWVPLARRYGWLDSLCTWASAPARMVGTVRRISRRKDGAPPGEVVKLSDRLAAPEATK
jgi:hypothetical protein